MSARHFGVSSTGLPPWPCANGDAARQRPCPHAQTGFPRGLHPENYDHELHESGSLHAARSIPILQVHPSRCSVSRPVPAKQDENLYSRCRYVGDDRLYMGRAVLSPTDLRVTGWTGAHHLSVRIPLVTVTGLERSSRGREPMLVIETTDGSRLALGVSAPGLWRWAIRERLPEGHVLAPAPEQEPAPVAAPPQRAAGSFALRVAYAARDRAPVTLEPRLRWRPLDELAFA